ncbi:hypothetical protein KFE98_19185 [bacterium SCSIO 12741]|nr:hypothetical protein KFE98_19185 [bacterium SCSIO 12741]
MKTKFWIWLVVAFSMFALVACNEEGDGEYYDDEEYYEDEYYEEEEYSDETEQPFRGPEMRGDQEVYQEQTPNAEDENVPDAEDEEPGMMTVKELRNYVVTDGKLDTEKVVFRIINTLKYVSEQVTGPGFTCDNIAYLSTNIMLPMERGQTSRSLYVSRFFGGKKYHFVLLNFQGPVSGKKFDISCDRNDMSYKELKIFIPEVKTQQSQISLLLAVTDANLLDVKTMLNMNWQIGGADASFKDFGTVQYFLKKDVPEGSGNNS